MDSKRFLTSRETAEYLDIPLQTLMQLNSQRKITYYKCGKKCYYDINDIYEYITRVKIPAGNKRKFKKKNNEEEANTHSNQEEVQRPQNNQALPGI